MLLRCSVWHPVLPWGRCHLLLRTYFKIERRGLRQGQQPTPRARLAFPPTVGGDCEAHTKGSVMPRALHGQPEAQQAHGLHQLCSRSTLNSSP